ncbi:FecR family protein [Flavobacteriaceae bacterium F08102]|nr:FecR family protein [Flavobacteriaceae bacterium F08102]
MDKKQAKKLFKKYIDHTCTQKELNLLEAFLDSYQDKKTLWNDLNIENEDTFKKTSWLKLHAQITKSKKSTRILYWKYAAAASIAIILSISIFLNKETSDPPFTEPIIVNNPIKNGSDKATLTLEDGSEITLIKGKSYSVKNATSNGEEIVYKPSQTKRLKANKKITYNYLTVPRGGQYQITLSDGTKIWLNSETQLKYPIIFTPGETRQVELVYGEAYFEVIPSTKYNGARFQVINKEQNIEVLGTKFNIKAYKDEVNIFTTLVEGKVEVSYNDKKEYLTPNQQSNYNVETKTFNIKTVVVYNDISWKDGVFSFEDKTLKEMMKVLSRWYDVEVEFKNKSVEKEAFVGILRKNQNLTNILETIKNFGIIKEYKINNKKITIQ